MKAAHRRRRREAVAATVRIRPVATTLPAAVEAALSAPGEPLDGALRAELERRLGHDFGDVRVHADARAAAAARTLDADAFTCGADIVFGAGHYRPGAEDGQWLIAHELVHTLQQGRAGAATALQVSLPSVPDVDALEREAADVAGRIAAGETVPPGTVTVDAHAARGRVARRARAAPERIPAEVPDSPEAVRALADDLARLLMFDPGDRFGRVKRRLARLAPATRAAVATELGGRIPATVATRLNEIVAELLPPDATAPTVEPLQAPAAAEPAEPSAVVDEPLAAAAELSPAELSPAEPSPAEIESAALEDLPEPVAASEGPVAEPELQGEVVAQEPEAAPVAVEEREEDRRAPAGGPAPAPETAEAVGPEEDAADSAPGDETEQEALEAHDEAEAEDVDESPDGAAVTAGAAPDPAPEGAAAGEDAAADTEVAPGIIVPEVAAQGATPEAGAAPGEAAAAREEAGESLDDSAAVESGEPPSPEQEPEIAEQPEAEPEAEEEAVVEPPVAELAGEDEEVLAEAPAAELEGAEQLETGAEAETEEPADPQLAGEESTADEGAPVDVGGDMGGAAPIEEPAEPETPDLSEADPAAAMDAVGTLPPAQSEAALTGVDAAASRSVGAQRAALAEQPPELDRPTGAPTAEELAAESEDPDEPPEAPELLERSSEPPMSALTPIVPLPPVPPPVAARAPAPQIPGGAQGELSEDGLRALRASLSALPVHDPALNISAGPAPAVTLEGATDPQRASDERAKLETVARGALADGRRAIVRPAGEQHLVPDGPTGRLRAAITPVAPAPPAAPPAAGPMMAAADPASILAREQRGAELRAAAKDAAAGMRTRRVEHAATAADERRSAQEQVTQLVRESAAQQAERRADARGEVHRQRQRWSAAEHELTDGKLAEADTELRSGVEEVARVKTDADEKAATHIATGERDAEQARRDGEEKAAAERKRGQEKSSGPLGWLADQATALFDEIKAGITKVFEVARAAVRAAIDQAKKLAAAAIDFARAAIVAAIRLAGDALIAIGDKLLAGFPGVRDRFRRAIEERVAKAQAAVNALAEGLKNVVQKALDGLGAALDAALGLLEKGLLLVVEGYRAVVAGALRWADGLVKAFGAFAVLVRHVVANPKQWLTNLAASAKDGVRNHLWKAFKAAIKRWFWEKVEEVLGLGLTIWNLLKKGGLSLARIGTMAWEAIKTAIPPTLIQILIEKLISLLIPAAAAVMLIIETLQAAWGTIQRVLEAFERFFAFLKAVRTGRAGPQFATAIAAAAIAVIDFVANWLLKRLRKPAGKIAKKLREIASKLGKKLAKSAKKLGKVLFGKRKKPTKLTGKRGGKPKPDKRAKAERRVKAATEFLSRQFAKSRPRAILWAQIQYASVRWRVRIRLRPNGERATLSIQANPLSRLELIEDYNKQDILEYNRRAAEYQGFLRKDHHRHHIFTRTHREWWEAAGIDWNAPEHMLEIPDALHLGVLHGSYKLLDAARGRAAGAQRYKNLSDAWNVVWGEWIVPRMSAVMKSFRLPPYAMFLETASAARRRQVRSMMRVKANAIVDFFSRVTKLPLWRFRLQRKDDPALLKRWTQPLAKFAAYLKKQGIKGTKKLYRIRRWKSQRALPAIAPKRVMDAITKYRKGS